jgi:hypothetical protein
LDGRRGNLRRKLLNMQQIKKLKITREVGKETRVRALWSIWLVESFISIVNGQKRANAAGGKDTDGGRGVCVCVCVCVCVRAATGQSEKRGKRVIRGSKGTAIRQSSTPKPRLRLVRVFISIAGIPGTAVIYPPAVVSAATGR